MNARGQIWYMDFVLGLTAFLLMFAVFVVHIDTPTDTRSLEDILGEVGAVSESLISSGYPPAWTNDTVQRIGITDNNHRVNTTMLVRFASLSYDRTKGLFGTKYDYVVFFADKAGTRLAINGTCLYGYGSNGTDCEPDIDADNLVKIERLVIINSTLRRMVVYGWN